METDHAVNLSEEENRTQMEEMQASSISRVQEEIAKHEPQNYNHYLVLLGDDKTDFYPKIPCVDVDY